MTTEIETATPAGQEAAEQVQSVESNSSEATTEQTQEQQQEQTQEQKDEAQKKEPWFQKRINEQTRKFYEAQREAQELKQRLAQYEQRQQYQAPDEQQEQRQHVDIDSLAEQRATQLLAERSFNEACNKVWETGAKEFQNFDAAVSNLQLVGVNRDFLDAVTATDAGHKILNHLGQLDNLPEAERILKLPPVQMGRELARLEAKLSQPVTKPVSKAPAPITPIGSSATSEVDPEKVSDSEWYQRVYLKNRK